MWQKGKTKTSQFMACLFNCATYRCDDMRAPERLIHHLRVFSLFAAQVEQEMASFRNILETSRRIMVDEDLPTINSLIIMGSMGHTIVCAPLSHISFTIFFLERGEGCADNMNAERAIVELPSEGSTRYSSWKDFLHVTLNAPSSVSAQIIQQLGETGEK